MLQNNNYNCHFRDNLENLDLILDIIQYIIHFLRYNIMVTQKNVLILKNEVHVKISEGKMMIMSEVCCQWFSQKSISLYTHI